MNPAIDEITQIVHRQQLAWNRADAAGYALECDENMSFTNITGKTLFGRATFEERHAYIFSTIFKESTLDLSIERIHFPAPDVAVVDIHAKLSHFQELPPGVRPGADGVLHTSLMEVLVRDGSNWRIASYHNVDVKNIG